MTTRSYVWTVECLRWVHKRCSGISGQLKSNTDLMFGLSLKNRKRSVDLYSLLGVHSVADVVRRGRLRWFGHLEHGQTSNPSTAWKNRTFSK